MRKFVPLLLLISFALQAQGTRDRAWLELNDATTLWASSFNAAGLAASPYKEFNTLSASYGAEGGDWRRMQTGTGVSGLKFDTQGARRIGQIQVWGRFNYSNSDDRGSSFNTLLYNPYDERFLYNVADTVAGQWKRQCYDMQFKLAAPLGDKFAAGLHVKYTDKIAAGQIDPRAESYNYCVDVRPGLVWMAAGSTIGLSGVYSNTFERSTPSISNSQQIQKVFIMRGLGNWVGDQVGGSGLSTMYYRCNSWGAALEYAWEGSWKLFSELSWINHGTRISESATQPKLHGNTRQDEFKLNVTALFGGRETLHRLCLDGSMVQTKGIEPTVLWNTAEGIWEVQNELMQCSFNTLEAFVAYDGYRLSGESYSWHWAGALGFEGKNDSYATPSSVFSYGNICARAAADTRIPAGKGSVSLGLGLEGVKNLSAGYSYSGHRSGTAPVRDLYPHNLAVLSASRAGASLKAEWAFPMADGLSLAVSAEGSGVLAFSSIGLLRRLGALGAVILYF